MGSSGKRLTFVSGRFRALLTLSKLVEIPTNASYTFRISISATNIGGGRG